MISPREPRADELLALTEVLAAENGVPPAEIADLLERSAVAVFDGYISDGPGFAGSIAIIVWPGGYELVTVLALTKEIIRAS